MYKLATYVTIRTSGSEHEIYSQFIQCTLGLHMQRSSRFLFRA